MKVISFDLSSVCVGVFAIDINSMKAISAPIIPPKFDATTLGYLKSKVNNTWVKTKDEKISNSQRLQRNTEVRNAKNSQALIHISEKINELIDATDPKLVLVEKNEIFNGVLTSVLLGKINGMLTALCAIKKIKMLEFPVSKIREPYNLTHETAEFIKGKTSEEISDIPDITKRVIRNMMEKKYNIEMSTDDEGDAAIVFDYYWNYYWNPINSRKGE